MKSSERLSFFALVGFIVIASIFGGILGNWLFIYFSDKYYDIPGGGYTSNSLPGTSIRNSTRSTEVNELLVAATAAGENQLVGLFSRRSLYLPDQKIGQAIILTSDGWLMTTEEAKNLPAVKELVAIASDKKVYDIDEVLSVAPGITFLHLTKVSNLPVQPIMSRHDLRSGQTLVALEWKTAVETGVVVDSRADIRSSEALIVPITVNGISGQTKFFFDTSGRPVGFQSGEQVASIETINNILTRYILKKSMTRPRLGVTYINTGRLPVETPAGVMITNREGQESIVSGSPAAKAGLRVGDIITVFDDLALDETSDLAILLSRYEVGDTVPVTIMRGQETRRITIILDEQSR